MKSPRQPFRPALVSAMKDAREALAAEVYASAAVKQALSVEAGLGLSGGVITTPIAVDLRETAAAKALITWLSKEGLRADWMRRGDPQKAHTMMADYWDLVVSWDGSPDMVVR